MCGPHGHLESPGTWGGRVPVSCPSAGGRACDPRRSRPLQGPLMAPPGRGGCPAAPSGLACHQHRGQLCPYAWRGSATPWSSLSHRRGAHTLTCLIMGTHRHIHVSLWGHTHPRLLIASRPCPAWTHTQTHTSLRSTDSASLGLELPFHLGASQGFRVPAGCGPPPSWPPSPPRGQVSPRIHHRLASPASSSCLNQFL